MPTIAGSSGFIIHFPQARVVPSNASRRLDFEAEEVVRQALHHTRRADMSAQVNRPQVKELDTIIDEQHHFLLGSGTIRGARGHADQVAIFLAENGDWFNSWALFAGESHARARHALQEIVDLREIDVQRNSPHLDTFKGHPRCDRVLAASSSSSPSMTADDFSPISISERNPRWPEARPAR